MDLSPDVKQQLMALAGMTDEKEFEEFVTNHLPHLASPPSSSTSAPPAAPSGGQINVHKNIVANRNCPFQMHFVKMLTAVESLGIEHFEALSGDIEAQVQYVYNALDADEFRDVRALTKAAHGSEGEDERLAAEESRQLRDSGNKASCEEHTVAVGEVKTESDVLLGSTSVLSEEAS